MNKSKVLTDTNGGSASQKMLISLGNFSLKVRIRQVIISEKISINFGIGN